MRKKFSIYHLLIAILLCGLFTPAVSASVSNSEVGSLTIYKYEQEPNIEPGENGDGSEVTGGIVGELLEGVTFTLTQTHSYDPSTDEWTEVSGTPVTYTTDDDGKIHIPNIELGRYKVQETDGPPHVVLNKEVYSVDIPMTSKDGSEVSYDVFIYPKNEIIRGSVELTKKDGQGEGTLAGVTFKLYHVENDEPVVKEENLVTNSEGKITVDGLAFGDYYFKETATVEEYMLNGEKVEFSITEQDAKVFVDLRNYKEPEVEKSVNHSAVNRGETVTYTITVELPGDIANYESFVITDELHENLKYVDGSQSNPAGFTFEDNGQTLTWTATPSALEPGPVEITFQAIISEDAEANEPINNVATIDYDNGWVEDSKPSEPAAVTPTVGSLVVKKVDGDDLEKFLPGAVFELRQGNELIATGTSGSDGIVDFDGDTDELDYGNYQLIETKAPEGYNKLRNPIEVIINADQQDKLIEVKNYASDWELPKTGGIGTMAFTFVGFLLMGASLFLYIRRRRQEIIE